MTKAETEKAGAAILNRFSTEADRVTQAQVQNAEAGIIVNSVGRVVVVSGPEATAAVARGCVNVFAEAAAVGPVRRSTRHWLPWAKRNARSHHALMSGLH